MGGLIGVVIQPSMERFIEDVREGTLDFTLTKPEEAQVLVSVGQVRTWRLLDVAAGPVIIAAALYYLGRGAGPEVAVKFGIALSAGSVIMYSFWLILATISFWFIRIENILMVFHGMYEAARWPVTIYPGGCGGADLPSPVTFAVTVPAQALVGRLTADFLIGTGCWPWSCSWSRGCSGRSGCVAIPAPRLEGGVGWRPGQLLRQGFR